VFRKIVFYNHFASLREDVPLLKLLIVEDDLASRELLQHSLQELKAEVHATTTSQEAAERVESEKFDGIFLDLSMPGLNGFDLAKIVRNSTFNKTTPIIIVTGLAEQDSLHHAFSVGATYFLQKPLARQSLATILEKIQKPQRENLRRFTRAPLNTGVTCTVGNRTLRGLTWNISQGGIQLEVSGLQQGDTIGMSFILPDPATIIKAEGVIVWVQEERQGVYFTGLNVEAQERIRIFVTRAGYG